MLTLAFQRIWLNNSVKKFQFSPALSVFRPEMIHNFFLIQRFKSKPKDLNVSCLRQRELCVNFPPERKDLMMDDDYGLM